jgi:DNA replication protein DnaC
MHPHAARLALPCRREDLSYGSRRAELLFKLINRRHERQRLPLTAHQPFAEWSPVFSNAARGVSLIDRFIRHAGIAPIGESHRTKEAGREYAEKRAKRKTARKSA